MTCKSSLGPLPFLHSKHDIFCIGRIVGCFQFDILGGGSNKEYTFLVDVSIVPHVTYKCRSSLYSPIDCHAADSQVESVTIFDKIIVVRLIISLG